MTDSHNKLSEIAVPTHVVVGGDDRLTTPEMAQEITGMILGAILTVILGAGHLVNIEKPAEFNRAVSAFISSRKGREAA